MQPRLAVESAIQAERAAREGRTRGLAALGDQRSQQPAEAVGAPMRGAADDAGGGDRADDAIKDGHCISSRRTFFCTLPIALRGSSVTKWTRLGTLKFASFAFRAAMITASVASAPVGAHDDRGHRLAEIGMGHADHGGFPHARQLVERQLDLLGVDVVAAADDQVLRASGDGEVAVLRETAHVAGAEVAVGRELLARSSRACASSRGRRWRPSPAHGRFRRGAACGAVVVDDAHVDAGERRAHRSPARRSPARGFDVSIPVSVMP